MLLALALIFGAIPATALAAGDDPYIPYANAMAWLASKSHRGTVLLC